MYNIKKESKNNIISSEYQGRGLGTEYQYKTLSNGKYLLVISNHPVNDWSNEQKEGWEDIWYIPFPNVPSESSSGDLVCMASALINKIKHYQYNIEIEDEDEQKELRQQLPHVSMQGESSLVYLVLENLKNKKVFPSTERIVDEKDGIKKSIFKFKKWREFN